jgi:surfactin synthase thioesterase subunit
MRELDGLIQSMTELDEFCSNQLPAATSDLSIRSSYDSDIKTKIRVT